MIAGGVLSTWLVLNIGLNFFNKEVFSERVGFTFPLFFTMFHMVRQHPTPLCVRQPSLLTPMRAAASSDCLLSGRRHINIRL